jgi:transposase
LSRTRTRLPLEVHDQVFTWVLERLAAHGLTRGERIGVDASTMEANAALRTIVRRDSGEGYREMLTAWPARVASRRRRPRTWPAIAKGRTVQR